MFLGILYDYTGRRKTKIRLLVNDGHYDAIATELIKMGIEIDDNAELVLSENNVCVSHLIARCNEEIYRLETKDILHIESFLHDIVAYCGEERYKLSESLQRLVEILAPKEFIRVSNSVIVSVKHIKSIHFALSQKFLITMKNGLPRRGRSKQYKQKERYDSTTVGIMAECCQ